jgi:hypothetical protein
VQLRYAFAAILFLTTTFLVGCGDDSSKAGGSTGSSSSSPSSNAPSAGAPGAGVIKGTALKQDGSPIASFGGNIYGYSGKSGQNVTASIDGANGKYATNTGPGQFGIRAWTDVQYNGRQYRIDLHPVDNQVVLHKYDATSGVAKDFVWKLDGFRPGVDERSDDRNYGHYGGSIMLSAEGHGATYQDITHNYGSAPQEKALPKEGVVELTLTPSGPLIDGSTGKPVVIKLDLANWNGYMDRLTRGIPIAKYNATAKWTSASGESKPLRVLTFDTFNKRKPDAAATTGVVEFVQTSPPSDNVNKVDEVNIHVMF